MKKFSLLATLILPLAFATPAITHAAPTPDNVALEKNTAAPLVPGREYMVVANHPNLLHVLDLVSNRVLKTCALPDAFGPGSIQIAPDRRIAYLLNNRFGSIYGIELDACKLVFKADMALQKDERAKSFFSIAVSQDGRELYTVQNPTLLLKDHYEVGEPRLAVYDTAAGLNAKPERLFPAPRQTTIMQTGEDGALYILGADLYKVDVTNGKTEVVLPVRDWGRPGYGAPDVLYAWPIQTPRREFMVLYTAPRFQDEKQDLEHAEYKYGLLSLDLKTGKTEVRDFTTLSEIYFSGIRSPKDGNLLFSVLNGLRKFDIAAERQIGSADLDHAYYQTSISHDGRRLYLSGTLNDVAVFDTDSLKRITTIRLPGGDMSLGTAQVFIR
ncbi:hypothetical protein FACS1894185_1230 [Betaproteobacteria bacterium]|nr:hypothetical protein AGMMS49545_03890 [Betaproteobacteria bacterium]GHU10255.1 hypothetical protein FACS1894185_1230 [Betaproteobacteria bacterium]GHU41812.1 hypothetical protein AGMMS50289_05570 [Betaproteobacteria bacterium]